MFGWNARNPRGNGSAGLLRGDDHHRGPAGARIRAASLALTVTGLLHKHAAFTVLVGAGENRALDELGRGHDAHPFLAMAGSTSSPWSVGRRPVAQPS